MLGWVLGMRVNNTMMMPCLIRMDRAQERFQHLLPWTDPIGSRCGPRIEEDKNAQEKADGCIALAKRVTELRPRNWGAFSLYGKALWEAGQRQAALEAFAEAVRLSAEVEGGLVEPVYALHAARTEIALDSSSLVSADGTVFELAKVLAFSSDTGEAASLSDDILLEILRDALKAMQWCGNADKYFYKAATVYVSLGWTVLFVYSDDAWVVYRWTGFQFVSMG